MADKSTIEWTDATWNPVRGCTKISPGCKHCYAERFAERFRGVPEHPFEQGFELKLVPHKLGDPLRWGKPRMIFVNSMSDLFHDEVPEAYISLVATTMHLARWHTYQVLTKRSGRLRDMLLGPLRDLAGEPHIWWASPWKTASTAYRESPTCKQLPLLSVSCPSSPCWRMSESFRWRASLGLSSAEKAARVPGR